MSEATRYTHKGWFGVCPCYFADPDGACVVRERHWSLLPLFWLSFWGYLVLAWLVSLVRPDAEVGFSVWLQEMDEPLLLTDD